jgi:hypothetical protein
MASTTTRSSEVGEVTLRGVVVVDGIGLEPVSLPPGAWCRICGRPEVFDGGELCADCAWMAASGGER